MSPADTAAARVLIADDQGDVLESLRLLLKTEGYQTESASSPGGAIDLARKREFDAVLMDLNYTRDTTSGREGLDLLSRLRALDETLPVVVMTAWGSVELAVEAMRLGARDFVQKPWENARLLTILRNQVELGRALRRGRLLEDENRVLRSDEPGGLIARSPAMQPVLKMIERIGPSGAAVLIAGEPGTGKGMVARALHAASPRSARPLVTVNAGGLSEGVFESELFGHVKGAFTDAHAERAGRFELADGGTLFLDEIANVPAAQQARLLRVLETGEFERVGSSLTRKVDVRLLTATNADLKSEVQGGRFRQDLFFRINTVEIRLPPLRERPEDLPLLAAHFLHQHAGRYRKPLLRFDEGALQAILAHRWPGNVRELEHAVERSVLLAAGDTVHAADLGLQPAGDGRARLDEMSLEEVERALIQKALARHSGNVSLAAQDLGLSRSGLYRRLKRHHL
jgi:DNA-binding NtrC family response regulator